MAKSRVVVGVCAMAKKGTSRPMREILERLVAPHGHDAPELEVVLWDDKMMLEDPIESWPKCDALIAFYSDGFPLDKARAYVSLVKPYVVNDLDKQYLILDRRAVYETLAAHGIPTPPHLVVNRPTVDLPPPVLENPGQLPERLDNDGSFGEADDYVQLGTKRINKPFVEKPVSGENHDIYIYYPHALGGGVKRLFRKVGNVSSAYEGPPDDAPFTPVRRNSAFIYEDFLGTNGTDVKVYTVGPGYAHAEARKSPVVDGRVMRDADGKELRFPVLLTPEEKETARRVCLAFGQTVCGFDLLRSKGKSYVCDVNGFSFVKNSKKYYEDCAAVLRHTILSHCAPDHHHSPPDRGISPELELGGPEEAGRPSSKERGRGSPVGGHEELRCVLAVVRHGDRTPKQKMKLRVTHPRLLHLMMKHNEGNTRRQAKLKKPSQLQELLDVTRGILASHDVSEGGDEREESMGKLQQVIAVLAEGGHFSGINRKAQIKPLEWEPCAAGERVTAGLLILKFGGVLTSLGKREAELLGRNFRLEMYPRSEGEGEVDGLLRLHSTFRHDLKIYSSDEGRVQMSAAAFAKGLLDLETGARNELTPILASLVNKDAKMLDFITGEVDSDITHAKEKLYRLMTGNTSSSDVSDSELSSASMGCPDDAAATHEAAVRRRPPGSSVESAVRVRPPGVPSNPRALLERAQELVAGLTRQLLERCRELEELREAAVAAPAGDAAGQEGHDWPHHLSAVAPSGLQPAAASDDEAPNGQEKTVPGGGESMLLMHARWRKLELDLYNERKGRFDLSKVPDIYDNAKYDALHNAHLRLDGLRELLLVSKLLSDGVVPNEYGTHAHSKLRIGRTIACALVQKLLQDLANTRAETASTASAASPAAKGRRKLGFLLPRGGSGPAEVDEDDDEDEDEDDVDVAGLKPVAHHETEEELSTTRLNAHVAPDEVKSPHRHVRTRVYFTSESHVHSLLNVLRFCHLQQRAGVERATPLLSAEATAFLDQTTELSYLTHIVFRMFERVDVPPDDPRRFRVAVSLSRGAAVNLQEDPAAVLAAGHDAVDALFEDGRLLDSRLMEEALVTRVPLQDDEAEPDAAPYLTLERLTRLLRQYTSRPRSPASSASTGSPGDFFAAAASGRAAADTHDTSIG